MRDKLLGMLERLVNKVKRFPASSGVVFVFLLLLTFTLYGVSRPVSHDRDFVEHLSRLPHVEVNEEGFQVSPLRNWSYEVEGPLNKSWTESPTYYEFGDLKKIWFLVEPHPGMEAMAHTLLLFEFSDDKLLGLTIEARREIDEGYSAFWGNWGKFELLYVWANARDLVQRRAIHLQKQVEIYPIEIERENAVEFLRRMLQGTVRIENKPRLYNTLFSNCTNEFGKNAGIGWHYSFITTGFAAEHLHSKGLIKDTRAYSEVRQTATITEYLRNLEKNNPALPAEQFDRELLSHLRQTWSSSLSKEES